MYRQIIRPLLFRLPAEQAHHFSFSFLKNIHRLPGMGALSQSLFGARPRQKPIALWNLEFKHPVGLAAGFDKDGLLFEELSHFGFSFIELGTVTPRPQSGNAQPRLFRLPQDQALINRMGFNNQGVDALVARLQKRKPSNSVLLGGNIGKNKDTPNEKALDDYLYCLEKLHPYVDYFVVNVSSPNTPNLRALQEKEPLQALLEALVKANRAKPRPRPLLLKIAPDLNQGQLDDILEIVALSGVDGIIATNTTIARNDLQTSEERLSAIGAGGLSGAPLRQRSTEVLRYLRAKGGPDLALIAVGGIFTAEDVREKLAAGANLVQVYTGFIYQGPSMVKNLVAGL